MTEDIISQAILTAALYMTRQNCQIKNRVIHKYWQEEREKKLTLEHESTVGKKIKD